MNTFEIIFAIGLFGLAILQLLQLRKSKTATGQSSADFARSEAEREQLGKSLTVVKSELDSEKVKRSELEGRGKQLFIEITNQKNDIGNLRTENSLLKERVAKHEAEKKQNEERQEEAIKKLEHSREKLESEQKRVQKEDEEVQQRALAERDRMWNEHENEVLSLLRETCKKPEIALPFFDNTNLPEGFYGQFKPDFLVEFLGQYLYLDAKVSRSEKLEVYLKAQFKSTAEKLKKFNGNIYKNVFFIVPTEVISTVKKRKEVIDGFTFFVISPEAVEPILSAYKRITEYENLTDFDPEEREKIVEVLANFEHFIKNQNTVNILFAQKAFEVLQKKESLSEELLDRFALELKKLKPVKFRESDFKKMSESVDEQQRSVKKLTAPEVKISPEELAGAEQLF